MLVLNAMDIPTKAVVDLDYALRHGESEGFLNSNDADVNAIRTHLASIAPTHGIALDGGWPTRRGSAMSAAAAFSLLAREATIQPHIESLKTKLLSQDIWIWTKGTIEEHLGCIAKNESAWSAFNNRLDTECLNAILPNDHAEICACIQWMVN
jgi:hypothetical protein